MYKHVVGSGRGLI